MRKAPTTKSDRTAFFFRFVMRLAFTEDPIGLCLKDVDSPLSGDIKRRIAKEMKDADIIERGVSYGKTSRNWVLTHKARQELYRAFASDPNYPYHLICNTLGALPDRKLYKLKEMKNDLDHGSCKLLASVNPALDMSASRQLGGTGQPSP